jgi:hypothetical protein
MTLTSGGFKGCSKVVLTYFISHPPLGRLATCGKQLACQTLKLLLDQVYSCEAGIMVNEGDPVV